MNDHYLGNSTLKALHLLHINISTFLSKIQEIRFARKFKIGITGITETTYYDKIPNLDKKPHKLRYSLMPQRL